MRSPLKVSIGYDPSGYVASVTDPLSRQVTFSRDAAGRPRALTIPDGQTVRRQRQRLLDRGNLAALAAPDFGSPSYAYDGALPTDTS